MLQQILSFLNQPAAQVKPPAWLIGLTTIAFLILGIMIAKGFWKRIRKQAEEIALATRNNQSEYDLAHRDITKVRQDLEQELATHGEFIRRWKRS